ncbi:MAG: hypothetical protein Q7K54_05235 [Candidatus Parcubacteria bacterium]|nr:hypothetical protein [Candidatus Parcubacteria bacterium]
MKFKILLICLVVMAFFVSSVTALTVKTDNMANATTNIEKTAVVVNNGAVSTDIAQNAIAISGAATLYFICPANSGSKAVASINFPNPFNANANNVRTMAVTEATGKSFILVVSGLYSVQTATATATGDNNAEVAIIVIVPTSAASGITLAINTSTTKPARAMEVAYVIGVKTYSSDAICGVIYLRGKSTTEPMTPVNFMGVATFQKMPIVAFTMITPTIETSAGANTDEITMTAATIVKMPTTNSNGMVDSMIDRADNSWSRTNSQITTTTPMTLLVA